MQLHKWNQVGLISLMTFLGYVVTGWFGMALTVAAPSITLFWPPIGIALTVLFRFGWRYWPVIFLSAVCVNIVDMPVRATLQIAFGNTLAPLGATLILRLLTFRSFDAGLSDLLGLFLASALGACISAFNGTAALWLSGIMLDPQTLQWTLVNWWMGDFAGLLIIGSLGLKWRRDDLAEARQRPMRLFLYICGLTILALLLFGQPFPNRADYKILAIAGLIILITLIGMSTNLTIGFGLNVFLAWIGVVGTAYGNGPLVDLQSHHFTLTSTWCWLIVSMLIVAILGSLHHALKQALSELEDEKHSYQALVEGNPALILRFSSTGEILFANDTAVKLFADSEQTFLRDNITRYIPQEDLSKVFELLASPDAPTNMDLQLTAVDGSKHIVRWKARNLRRGTNLPAEFLAVGFDVTDLRRAERERREFLERLYQSKKLESLGVMAGGIAHDFNNLLTGIMGHAELARELVLAEEPVGQHLAQIEQSASRAAELVLQMMAYAGLARVKIAQFDLNALILETLELIRINLPAKVELRFQPQEAKLMIQADPVQIRQVLMNLIINAGEAIGDNAGKIEIQAHTVALTGDELLNSSTSETRVNLPPGDYIRLRVRDTGRGMDQATRKRIFEPFFSTKFQGRGLGLASVLGIVQAHSGTIGASSVPGRGTLFTVLLPTSYRKPSDAVGTPPIQGVSSTDLKALPAGGQAFIYLTQPELQATVLGQLKLLGWQTVTEDVLSSLKKAVQSAPSHPLLVIVGISPTDPIGREITRLLKTPRPHLKAILVTAFNLHQVTEELRIPSSAFLIIPFTPTDLVNTMIRLFTVSR